MRVFLYENVEDFLIPSRNLPDSIRVEDAIAVEIEPTLFGRAVQARAEYGRVQKKLKDLYNGSGEARPSGASAVSIGQYVGRRRRGRNRPTNSNESGED